MYLEKESYFNKDASSLYIFKILNYCQCEFICCVLVSWLGQLKGRIFQKLLHTPAAISQWKVQNWATNSQIKNL